jgi:hypothetical protein
MLVALPSEAHGGDDSPVAISTTAADAGRTRPGPKETSVWVKRALEDHQCRVTLGKVERADDAAQDRAPRARLDLRRPDRWSAGTQNARRAASTARGTGDLAYVHHWAGLSGSWDRVGEGFVGEGPRGLDGPGAVGLERYACGLMRVRLAMVTVGVCCLGALGAETPCRSPMC